MHACSVALPGGTDYIEFEELDEAGDSCRARAADGTMASGRREVVLASPSGRSTTDEWVRAVVAALDRERGWESDRRSTLEVWLGEGELLHLSAPGNRDSITRHGLDWNRIGEHAGLAGARAPELDVVFLCADEADVRFFLRVMDRAMDVWAVDVSGLWLENGPSGWVIVPEPIARRRVRLVRGAVGCW